MIVTPDRFPSFARGYAYSGGMSAAPHMWQNLKGAWVMAFGQQGSVLQDLSRHGYTAFMQTALSPTTDWITESHERIPGPGVDFTQASIDEFYQVTGLNTPVASNFSCLAWVDLQGIAGQSSNIRVISAMTGLVSGSTEIFNHAFYVGTFDGTDTLLVVESNATGSDYISVTGNTNVPTTRLHQVGFTFDGTTFRFYLDGKLDAEETWPGSALPTGADQNYKIGNRLADVDILNMDGSIVAVLYYERVLHSAEFAMEYQYPLLPFRMKAQRQSFVPAQAGGRTTFNTDPRPLGINYGISRRMAGTRGTILR